MKPEEHPATRRPDWLLTLALSVLVAVAFGTLFYAFSVLITEEAAGAEFSLTLLSVAWSGALLIGGSIAFLIGRHIDRHGVRGVMGGGAVLGAAGLALVALAREPWQVVLIAWLFIGPGGAMTFYEPAFVAVDQWFGHEGRARALASLTFIGGLAGLVFLPLTSVLISAVGWRWAAVTLGGTLLVTGLAAAVLVFPRGAEGGSSADGAPPVRFTALIRDRRFTLYTAATLLTFGSLQAIFFHRIAAFEDAGFGVTAAASWAAVASLLSLPGRYAAPYLSNRIPGLLLNATANMVLAFSVVLAAVAAAGWHMVGHFVVFGLTFGVLLPLRAVVMSEWYSGPGYGRIMGTQWSLVAVIAAAGPLLVGVLTDSLGSYLVPLMAVAAALALAGLLNLASPRPDRKELPLAPSA